MSHNYAKIGISAFFGILSAYMGWASVPLILLLVLMLADYGTGIAAAWIKGTLSSRKSISGILKKVGYLAVIAVGMTCDFLIEYGLTAIGQSVSVSFAVGLVIIIWLILNECLSILENLSEMGVPVPGFLCGIVNRLKIVSEKKMTEEEQLKDESDQTKGVKKE